MAVRQTSPVTCLVGVPDSVAGFALAHRERATVYCNDTDFLRTPRLTVGNPLVA